MIQKWCEYITLRFNALNSSLLLMILILPDHFYSNVLYFSSYIFVSKKLYFHEIPLKVFSVCMCLCA